LTPDFITTTHQRQFLQNLNHNRHAALLHLVIPLKLVLDELDVHWNLWQKPGDRLSPEFSNPSASDS
jgi:hypothetical protein